VKRLSPATLTLLMLLIVGGLVLAYVGKKLLARDETPAVDPLINVPMAIADLEPGTKITAAHLAIGNLLRSKLTRDIVKSDRVLIGRVVKTKIKAAQPVSTTDLYAPNDGPPLNVGAGMRAVTISLSDGTAAVDGLVKAGDHVDILFIPAFYRDMAKNGGMIMTLFKGVHVIAMNQDASGSVVGSRGANTVTLEMTPDHANILRLASQKGQMTLTYTPDGKAENQFALRDQDRAYFDEILGLKTPEEKKSEDKRVTVTELFSGASRRLQTFKDGLRSDRYAIERLDYNRAAAYANNYGYGYGDYGYGAFGGYNPAPPLPPARNSTRCRRVPLGVTPPETRVASVEHPVWLPGTMLPMATRDG
jgi:pilus assembly protein CpaB